MGEWGNGSAVWFSHSPTLPLSHSLFSQFVVRSNTWAIPSFFRGRRLGKLRIVDLDVVLHLRGFHHHLSG